MIRQYEPALLDPWLDAYAASNVPDLVTCAAGIRQDYAAVRAALTTQGSNGQTEGQAGALGARLKFIKRSMYHRASFDLLRLHVLHAN